MTYVAVFSVGVVVGLFVGGLLVGMLAAASETQRPTPHPDGWEVDPDERF